MCNSSLIWGAVNEALSEMHRQSRSQPTSCKGCDETMIPSVGCKNENCHLNPVNFYRGGRNSEGRIR